MGLQNERGLQEITLNFSGGVDELSAVTQVPLTSFLVLDNWRIAEDGKRIEKRDGIQVIDADIHTSVGAHDVFGYHTYYNSTPAFCQITIAEDKVYRKEGAGAWASIKTWGTTVTHPLKMLEIQKMQYCITETENFKLLATAAAAAVPVGIVAPATIPTITATYASTLLNWDCTTTTGWADIDTGAGVSSAVVYGGYNTFRFLNTGVAGDMAGRNYTTMTGMGSEYVVEIDIYPHMLGTYQLSGQFQMDIFNGRTQTQLIIDKNDVYVHSGITRVSCGVPIFLDKWQNFKFYVNTVTAGEEYVEVFKDGVSFGAYKGQLMNALYAGRIQIHCYGISVATDVYLKTMKIGGVEGGKIVGLTRYALTYARGGDYGHESNPIYGLVGAKTFTGGAGNDDMTTGGTYSGAKTQKFRIYIDTIGAVDTFKWSSDEGQTWSSSGIPLAAKVYLPYGIELAWTALTSHIVGDYWDFTCWAMSTDAIHQTVTLTSIPVSTDTQVTQRRLYRTTSGGTQYYLLAIINDNTTTTFVDNIHQEVLAYGDLLRFDRDVPPVGRFSVWWDDRLWVGVHSENMVYYSYTDEPEAFDLENRWISLRSGEAQDTLTGLVAFKGYLYYLKRNSIGIIQKRDDGSYSRFLLCNDYGNIAPWSLQAAGELLMFLSHRGWEVYNGCLSYSALFSRPIKETLTSISGSYLEQICSCVNRKNYEVWLSLPDRTNDSEGVARAAVTAIVNYTSSAFYRFSFAKVPSYIGEARDSSGDLKTYIGTRDGYVCLAESGTDDIGTAITATARSPWLRFPEKYSVRRAEYEAEIPTGITLSIDFYVNMENASSAPRSITGSTPATATDRSIRLPIFDELELDLNAQYLSMKITNAGAVGSSLKVNALTLYYRSLTQKLKIVGN